MMSGGRKGDRAIASERMIAETIENELAEGGERAQREESEEDDDEEDRHRRRRFGHRRWVRGD